MKNKFNIIVLAVLFTLNFSAFAQFEVLQDIGSGAPLRANPYPDIKGVPFIEDFAPGAIIYTVKDTLKNIPIRFNSYDNLLELNKNGDVYGLSSREIVGFIASIDGKPSLFRSGIDIPKVGKDVFVHVIVEGEYSLVKYRYKVLIEDPSAAYGSQRSKSFQNKNEIYISTPKGVFPFKSNKKQIQEIFEDDSNKFFEIQSKLGLSIKEENDLVKILNTLNSSI